MQKLFLFCSLLIFFLARTDTSSALPMHVSDFHKSIKFRRAESIYHNSFSYSCRDNEVHETRHFEAQREKFSLLSIRGGSSALSLLDNFGLATPTSLFNSLLLGLAILAVAGKTTIAASNKNAVVKSDVKPASVSVLQYKFLGE